MIHQCPYCNKAFTAKRKDKIYCSPSCKQMAFVKRQGTLDFISQKRQNINTINHQLTDKVPNSQNVKPSDTFPIHKERLKEELYTFAEAAIKNKLEELIHIVNISDLQNVNRDAENVNPDLDLFGDKQSTILEFQGEQKDEGIHKENEASIKEQSIKTLHRVDALDNEVLKKQTTNSGPQLLIIEQEIYTPIKCKWINELYERFNERGNDEKLSSPATIFKDKADQVERVSIYYLCLLECVITISEMKAVDWDDLAELTNAFTFLTATKIFKELPNNYPFKKDIVLLRDKLKCFCLETKQEDYVKFRLKFGTKKQLFLERFELSLVFPKINFKQLQLYFKETV